MCDPPSPKLHWIFPMWIVSNLLPSSSLLLPVYISVTQKSDSSDQSFLLSWESCSAEAVLSSVRVSCLSSVLFLYSEDLARKFKKRKPLGGLFVTCVITQVRCFRMWYRLCLLYWWLCHLFPEKIDDNKTINYVFIALDLLKGIVNWSDSSRVRDVM